MPRDPEHVHPPAIKEWPRGNETVYFEDLITPLRAALDAAYELKRRPLTDIPYDGYDIGQDDRATCLSPDEALSAKSLEWVEEDQGRDAATTILILAAQLGIEQGRRIANQRHAREDGFPRA